MSKHDFIYKYIFGATARETKLAVALGVISASCLVANAVDPAGMVSVENAKILGSLNAQELLAAVTLASIALSAYCMKTMVSNQLKQNAEATRALTQIAERMAYMKCVREHNKPIGD